MRGAVAPAMLVLLAGCQPRAAAPPLSGVVSIDFCADQMALGLLPKDQIKAVSFETKSDATFAGPRARGIATVRPQLEDIARLHPAVVVRSYGGGGRLNRQLKAMGVRVVQLGFPNSLPEVRDTIIKAGDDLGATKRADQLVAGFDAQISAAKSSAMHRPTALYVTPGDVTTGPGSLVADVMSAAGTRPYRQQAGWGSLPLEDMVRRPPDIVFRAFFDSSRYRQDYWAASRHPVARAAARQARDVEVPGGWLACGNWLTGQAIQKLALARQEVTMK